VKLSRLIWKNVTGNGFRSLAILLCAALVAGLALAATLVIRGAEASLRLNLQRLGADILVLPWGTMTEKIGGARLVSAAIDGWMPRAYMDRVARLDGVAQVSPQLHLATWQDDPLCPGSEAFLVAYDPATDFVLHPWLEQNANASAAGRPTGTAIVGARIEVPDGNQLTLYGQPVQVTHRLASTATSIDQTVFVDMQTAERIIASANAENDQNIGDRALKAEPGTFSAVMVKVELGSDPHEVAVRILEQVPGVVPLETPDLFQTERRQMVGILRTMWILLAVIWGLTVTFMALVFTVAVHERRAEIGVLRALGFPQVLVLKALLLEGAVLALLGGLMGVTATGIGFVAFSERVVQVTRLPLQLPSPAGFVSLSLGGQMMALISVVLAAFVPAWKISRQDVALVMRD